MFNNGLSNAVEQRESVMGWLRLVGSLKIIGLFCKRALQKRPKIIRSLNRSHAIVVRYDTLFRTNVSPVDEATPVENTIALSRMKCSPICT